MFNFHFFSRHAGLDIKQYRYYDKSTCGLDINGMLEDLNVSITSFRQYVN